MILLKKKTEVDNSAAIPSTNEVLLLSYVPYYGSEALLVAASPSIQRVRLGSNYFLLPFPWVLYAITIFKGVDWWSYTITQVGVSNACPTKSSSPIGFVPLPNIQFNYQPCYKTKHSVKGKESTRYIGVCSAVDDWWAGVMNLDLAGHIQRCPVTDQLMKTAGQTSFKKITSALTSMNSVTLKKLFTAWESVSLADALSLDWDVKGAKLSDMYGQSLSKPQALGSALSTI